MILHHEIGGPADGSPVLLAGSLGTTLRMWDGVVARLRSRGYRTIAYDQLGHGASPAPAGPYTMAQLGEAALALMDHLGIERAAFAGLSLGGMAGQWLAAHAPERVDRLVLLCTSAHLAPPDPWLERARVVRAAGSVDPIADAVAARWVTPAFAQRHPDALDALRAMLAAQPPEGYGACCEAIAAMDQRKDLASISAPTLVIGGAQDLAIPAEHQRRLAEAIAHATLTIFDPGAHIVAIERADTTADAIEHHLEAA